MRKQDRTIDLLSQVKEKLEQGITYEQIGKDLSIGTSYVTMIARVLTLDRTIIEHWQSAYRAQKEAGIRWNPPTVRDMYDMARSDDSYETSLQRYVNLVLIRNPRMTDDALHLSFLKQLLSTIRGESCCEREST